MAESYDGTFEKGGGIAMKGTAPDYTQPQTSAAGHMLSFLAGFAVGFGLLFIFYKIALLSLFGGLSLGAVNIFASSASTVKKRRIRLRSQFFDLLEAMSVSIRAGNPLVKSLQNAREDLMLIYPENADILVELDIIIGKFHNSVPLSKSFFDLATRSRLEDISSFATIYATIEGKSGKADEIVRDTQQIISDKMEIEMEIDTLMTAAKSEVNIMMLMPIVILGVIGYAGAGFMDTIYTTAAGRVVSTIGLAVFVISFLLARKFSNVRL